MVSIILNFILGISLIIIISILFGYPLLVSLLSKNKTHKRINQKIPITVIIPTYNEEKNIERKITNLLNSNYPKDKIKIFIVDNGSTDKTIEKAKKFPVEILISERGKINAINLGIKKAKTDAIIVTDADTTIEKNCISKSISCLHGDIGAVSAFTILKTGKIRYIENKIEYYKKEWNLRYKESLIDSCCNLDGKFMLFRKKIFRGFPKNAVVDDYEITFLIRKKGYRCIIDKEAIVYEDTPLNWKEDLKQMRRRSALPIAVNSRYLNFLFARKYGFFGLFTFPFRRFLIFFIPFLLLYILSYLYLIINPIILSLFILFIITSLFALKKEYYIILISSIILGWYNFIMGNIKTGGIWGKIKS